MHEQSIGPDYFYHFSHQLIFDSLLELHRENKQPDEILLAEKLSTRPARASGRSEGLIDLTSRIQTTACFALAGNRQAESSLADAFTWRFDGANDLQGAAG